MSDGDDRILVVLQLGSTQVRCGLSGDDAPRRQLVHVINGRNPVKEGILQDPEDFVTIVRGCVGEDMDCATETRGIIVCDPPTNTPESRKMLAAVLFDVFHFPAVRFFSRTPLCALSACITTALVVEFGDEHTYVMPVVGCVGIRHALIVGPIAGRQITAWLMKKVQAYNPSLVLQDKLGFNNIGGIKHQCPVAPSKEAYTETYQDALAEEKAFFEESAKKSSEKSSTSSAAQPAEEGETGYVLLGSVKHQDTDTAVHEIKLPPAGILTAAPEALFQPQLLLPDDNKAARGSLAELIVDSIRAIDAETATPELIVELYSHVVIAGRGCMFPGGFAERLTLELTPLAAAAHGVQDLTVIADPARSSGAWVGASVLSSMRDTEANGFVTNAMWETHGPSIFDSWSTE
ncbi:actin-like protein, putative [Bodo saltans]|uniref:Actin-like protein, putative n=1 Tax=Bodo saltans TaxID=75058 RepID=A0A0S4IUQ1_BODSA|nr:actin-like protein, putative [Bodo saltans]|eukprot:CUF98713.1 actin-like protein, putative [Bodo saltans]